MSELIQKNKNYDFRWKLLAEASMLALMGCVAAMPANAEEIEQPTVWIELGGQLSHWQSSQETYAPSFVALTPSNLSPPQTLTKPPRYGIGESAALILQPKGSDWIFSASVFYGRSSNSKHVRQQSHPGYYTGYSRFRRNANGNIVEHTNLKPNFPIAARFTDAATKQSESHTIVDFQAGKDLGIGLFGGSSSSSMNVGVRFAQFTSKASIALKEDPDWQFKPEITGFHTSYATYYGGYFTFGRTNQVIHQPYHSFAGVLRASRSFSGLGPTISWKSSELFAGNSDSAELTFDWGVNAALLFGRQKARTHHQTSDRYSPGGYYGAPRTTLYDVDHPSAARSRGVVVPNLGGFAGLSFKYAEAKVSFGYRADFFFGAMDGGIDARHTGDVGFYGPFATLSVGLGG